MPRLRHQILLRGFASCLTSFHSPTLAIVRRIGIILRRRVSAARQNLILGEVSRAGDTRCQRLNVFAAWGEAAAGLTFG